MKLYEYKNWKARLQGLKKWKPLYDESKLDFDARIIMVAKYGCKQFCTKEANKEYAKRKGQEKRILINLYYMV